MTRIRPDQAAYLRARRVSAFADGRCYECCLRPRLPDKRRCAVCTDRNLERRTDIGVGQKCRGLCGQPSAPGRARCDACLARHREYMATRRRDAGIEPRATAPRPRRIMTPRGPRKPTIQTSAVPPAPPFPARADGPPKVDSGPPAEVDLSTRRAVIAALAVRRAA